MFNALDAVIQNLGVYPYLVFVWLSLLVIAWVLSGSLRRKHPQENSAMVVPGIIIAMQPPTRTPASPIIGIEIEQTRNGDDETTD
jgi:uncharacterized membrane protein